MRLEKCERCDGQGRFTNGNQCPDCRGYGDRFAPARSIFINRAIIQKGANEAPISIHDGERVIARGYTVRILEGCEIVYSERPLRPGGARVWIETMGDVEIIGPDGPETVKGVSEKDQR